MIPSLPLRVLTRTPRPRFSVNGTPVARYNQGPSNKSLDASRTSGLVIDNLRLTWLRAAASTQPFDAFSLKPKMRVLNQAKLPSEAVADIARELSAQENLKD